MKTIKQKPKSRKRENGRFTRVKFGNKEPGETVAPDLSQLRKPIDISVSSLLEVTKLLEIGGDEVKTMLAYECDVIYECRVCRSLFRSLANFISHKRVYCKEKFNITLSRKIRSDHIIPAGMFIADPELTGKGKCKENDNIRILRSQVVRNSSKKDLTSVVDMLQRKRSEDINENSLTSSSGVGEFNEKIMSEIDSRIATDKVSQHVFLEGIDSTKSAVYQTATATIPSANHTADLMKAQIVEIENMVSRDTAVLNPEGQSMDTNQSEKSDSPLQIYGSDDDEGVTADTHCSGDLVCSVCNAKFATRKTLTYHMKSLHVSYRTCYPCPCCSSTFANTWSVYRHLFKVHRKTNEQVRKLRTQIQEKAFRKETTGAEDIEKENATSKSSSKPEQQMSNNTQEWMEHFEHDLELQRCGGCGRRFDRKAALIAHSQLCQKRIAACNEAAAGNKAKRLSKTPSPNNVVDDKNPPPEDATDCVVANRAQSEVKQIPKKEEVQVVQSSTDISGHESDEVLLEIINNNELSIRVENVSRISDADWDMIDNNLARSPINEIPSETSISSIEKESQSLSGKSQSLPLNVPDSPEIIFTSIDKARTVAISFGKKKRRVSLINNSKELSNGSVENENSVESSPIHSPKEKETNDTSHMAVMENKIAMIANLRKLQCLPCRRKFTSMTNLRRHMAIHIGWNRYRCRLCDFKCFVKCDCVAHCNRVHDAGNNRAIIADMVVQIPPDLSVLSQDVMMDISNSCEAQSEPEIIDVTATSPQAINVTEGTGDLNSVKSLQDKSMQPDMESHQNSADVTKINADSKEIDCTPEKSTNEQIVRSDKEKLRPDNEVELNKEVVPVEETSQETQGRLDKDPDLRKMVMEVIFGTAESNAALSTDPETVETHQTCTETKNESQGLESSVKTSLAKDPTIANDDSKTRSCLSVSKLEEIRPQRPMRNRVKPVHEDFIYDLTELIRKESASHRMGAPMAHKSLRKKQLNQQQAVTALLDNESNGDHNKSEAVDTDLQKLSSSCDYNTKFSLRQASVKLNSCNSFISSSKNCGNARVSISLPRRN